MKVMKKMCVDKELPILFSKVKKISLTEQITTDTEYQAKDHK